MKKKLLSLIMVLIICSCSKENVQVSPKISNDLNYSNALIIGWDGTERSNVQQLLAEGKLPHLKSLVDIGSWVNTSVRSDDTETKPGWSQVLTGYNAKVTGVVSNKFYSSIPQGITLFERIGRKYGKDLKLIFLAGKEENLGNRGPHRVCMNCINREADTQIKTRWYDDSVDVPLIFGKKKITQPRNGEPYFNLYNSKMLHTYQNALWESPHVLAKYLEVMDTIKQDRFLAFVHFQEPDEDGHVYGVDSIQYRNAIIQNDVNLGIILNRLKSEKVFEKTAIIVLSEHGFDKGKKSHMKAPETFLVSNIPQLKTSGDRLDIAPTLYRIFGVDTKLLSPKLEGTSLIP